MQNNTYVEPPAGQEDKFYALLDQISDGGDGFTLADYKGVVGRFM